MNRALLGVLLLATACGGKKEEAVETTAAVAVKVEAAHVGPIAEVVTATGTVEPAPGADWTILAPAAARVAEIRKAEGDAVRKGELLVRFDAPTLRADASARTAEAAQARAALDNARRNHERLSGLLQKGIASRKEVEDARKELLDAEAAVRGSASAASNAAVLSGEATVVARFDGVVARRWHNPGDLVEAAASDPVLRVIDPARLQVTASVPVSALPRIQLGQPVQVILPGSDVEMHAEGRVVSRPAAVDPATGTAVVRTSVSGALAAGTPVRIEIAVEQHADALLVPAAAVLREDEETAVFVVGSDGKAHRRPVTLGIETPEQVQVVSGLVAGEKVVVEGNDELPDGATVTAGS